SLFRVRKRDLFYEEAGIESRLAIASNSSPRIQLIKKMRKKTHVPEALKSICRSAGTERFVHRVPRMGRKPPAHKFSPMLRYSAAKPRRKLRITAATAGVPNAAAYMRPWNASTSQGQKRVRASGAISKPIP